MLQKTLFTVNSLLKEVSTCDWFGESAHIGDEGQTSNRFAGIVMGIIGKGRAIMLIGR